MMLHNLLVMLNNIVSKRTTFKHVPSTTSSLLGFLFTRDGHNPTDLLSGIFYTPLGYDSYAASLSHIT